MLKFAANILVAVLPCLGYEADKEGVALSISSNGHTHTHCNVCHTIGIYKMAQKVNNSLKSLINEGDDGDLTVDLTDEIQIKLLSSPVNSSPTPARKGDSSAEGVASETSPTVTEGVAEGVVNEEQEESEAGSRPRAFAREEQEVVIKFSLLPVLGRS